jgi:amino-acid N-acetyltransferase
VVDGIDFQYTGAVRKVIAEEIQADLAQENVVLITPIGASPTGEIFNLAWEEVAEAVAVCGQGRQADLPVRCAGLVMPRAP